MRPLCLCSQIAEYYRNGATWKDFISEEDVQKIIDEKKVVTYHANYAGNKDTKLVKLKRFGLAHSFNVNKNAPNIG